MAVWLRTRSVPFGVDSFIRGNTGISMAAIFGMLYSRPALRSKLSSPLPNIKLSRSMGVFVSLSFRGSSWFPVEMAYGTLARRM